ncbi:hypothetical protein K5D37_24875 [Pseudomonas cichorii]|nr:hypothetical protein [Pseudomonas cichorii]
MNTKNPQPAMAPGELDPDFGDAGIVRLTFSNGVGMSAAGLTLTTDEKIYVAGPASGKQYGLARLNQDGSPDETFGTSGIVTGKFDTYDSWALAVQILPDTRLVLRGMVDINNVDYPAFACFSADGVLDTSFGTNGWVILIPPFATVNWTGSEHKTPLPSAIRPDSTSTAEAFQISPSGKILVSARIDSRTAIVSLSNDGSLDTSFGGTGYVIVEPSKHYIWLGAIYDLSSKLLAAGSITTDDGGVAHPFLVRYNENGSIDKNFGTNGTVTIDTESGQFTELALTDPGAMVCIGYTLGSLNDKAMLMGRNQDGSPNSAFNKGDPVFTVLGDNGCAWISGALVQGTQKLAVTGMTFGEHSLAIIGRFEEDGSADLSFGDSGLITLDLGVHTLSGALVVQSDRKIIIGGQVLTTTSSFGYVARYLG